MNSDSEFYYPDDLSDTELLQQPTFIESGEKSQNYLEMKKLTALSRTNNKKTQLRKQDTT